MCALDGRAAGTRHGDHVYPVPEWLHVGPQRLRDSRTLGRGHSILQERFAIRSAEGRPALFGIAGRTAASGISRVRTAAGRAARRRR